MTQEDFGDAGTVARDREQQTIVHVEVWRVVYENFHHLKQTRSFLLQLYWAFHSCQTLELQKCATLLSGYFCWILLHGSDLLRENENNGSSQLIYSPHFFLVHKKSLSQSDRQALVINLAPLISPRWWKINQCNLRKVPAPSVEKKLRNHGQWRTLCRNHVWFFQCSRRISSNISNWCIWPRCFLWTSVDNHYTC